MLATGSLLTLAWSEFAEDKDLPVRKFRESLIGTAEFPEAFAQFARRQRWPHLSAL